MIDRKNERLTSPSVVKKICEEFGFRFKKGLGQNFLIDHQVVVDIVEGSGIDESTHVIEIGPGFGSMTQELLLRAKSVTAVEVDSTLIPVLTGLFSEEEHFKLIHRDVLKFDLNEIITEQPVKIVANLPYYITSPILTYLLEKRYPLQSITVMVQKEVAKRMVAEPGSKDYGALSCLIQYYTEPTLLRIVKPTCFLPAPKVDSAVVMLSLLPSPRVSPQNEVRYFQTVKAVFAQRRKTLGNALSNSGYFNRSKGEIESLLEQAGYNPMLRGETLSLEDYCKISDVLE